VRREHNLQGATNVTVRNIITSMRLVSDVDWAKLFEQVSPVDDVLRAGSDFATMDFATRNLYRTAIEEMARGTDLTELEIARRALEAASSAPGTCDGDRRQRDPGYHLIGGGRRTFERSLDFRPRGLALRRRFTTTGIAGYVVSVSMTAAVVLFLPLLVLAQVGITGWQLAVMVLIGLLPAIDAALMLVNRAITGGFGATLLPCLDLRDGVPPHLRTLVAIPTLLTTRKTVEEQIQRLEVHYLSNPAGAIHFALLSDGADSHAEWLPGDDALVAVATAGIARLNARYPNADGADRFFCCIGTGSGTKRRASGWDGSASAASSMSSIVSCVVLSTRRSSTADRARCPSTSVMSSRSTPTRACRATRSSGSSARWRIRSTGRVSTRSRAVSSKAMACCSRA